MINPGPDTEQEFIISETGSFFVMSYVRVKKGNTVNTNRTIQSIQEREPDKPTCPRAVASSFGFFLMEHMRIAMLLQQNQQTI